MKKYKLIKTYPSLHKSWYEGMLVKQEGAGNWGIFRPCTGALPDIKLSYEEVVGYPEFWEEVKELNYEIISFKNKLLNTKILKSRGIQSVKRLSDGEIFTVGDLVCRGGVGVMRTPCSILSFSFNQGELICNVKKGYAEVNYPFDDVLYKLKPLFISEDGVEIFEGDIYYKITNTFNIRECVAQSKYNFYKDFVVFSTKEATEEYILMNKPCLSINDIMNNDNITITKERLINLVKTKI